MPHLRAVDDDDDTLVLKVFEAKIKQNENKG